MQNKIDISKCKGLPERLNLMGCAMLSVAVIKRALRDGTFDNTDDEFFTSGMFDLCCSMAYGESFTPQELKRKYFSGKRSL